MLKQISHSVHLSRVLSPIFITTSSEHRYSTSTESAKGGPMHALKCSLLKKQGTFTMLT